MKLLKEILKEMQEKQRIENQRIEQDIKEQLLQNHTLKQKILKLSKKLDFLESKTFSSNK